MGRVLCRLGLKPKLLFGLKWRGTRKTSGQSVRPGPLYVASWIKSNTGVVGVAEAASGQGEGDASPVKVPVVRAIESDEAVLPVPSGKVPRSGFLGPVSSSSLEEEVVLALGDAESSST